MKKDLLKKALEIKLTDSKSTIDEMLKALENLYNTENGNADLSIYFYQMQNLLNNITINQIKTDQKINLLIKSFLSEKTN